MLRKVLRIGWAVANIIYTGVRPSSKEDEEFYARMRRMQEERRKRLRTEELLEKHGRR